MQPMSIHFNTLLRQILQQTMPRFASHLIRPNDATLREPSYWMKKQCRLESIKSALFLFKLSFYDIVIK